VSMAIRTGGIRPVWQARRPDASLSLLYSLGV
jgi:hypothetical protein